MGCAAATGTSAPKQKEQTLEETVSDPGPQIQTWAAPDSTRVEAFSDGLSSASTSPSSAKKSPVKDAAGKDADDDDEIEIIYETAPKKIAQEPREPQIIADVAAANGQEAPEAVEVDARRKAEEARQKEEERKKAEMSKSQQEEAAKLAERRKKFDNERYHQPEQKAPQSNAWSVVDIDSRGSRENLTSNGWEAPAASVPTKSPISSMVTTSQVKTFNGMNSPSHDMVFGLNQATSVSKDPYSLPGGLELDLPGGIMDELDALQQPVVPTKKKNTHDDVVSQGFDEDDEKMMAEILQDLDM